MNDYPARLIHRLRFSKTELYRLAATTLAGTFGLTLSSGWGFFDLIPGNSPLAYIFNFVIVYLMLYVVLLIHFAFQKATALNKGYSSEYTYWMNGMLIGVLICFFSFGYLPVFFVGALWMSSIPNLRLGHFRGGVMHKDLGMVGFSGPFSNLVVAGLVAPIYIATNNAFVYAFIVLNILTAVFSMIPIPTFEKVRQFKGGTSGLYIYIASRWAFFLVFSVIIVYSLLVLVAHIFSYVVAIILGSLIAVIYFNTYEEKVI